MTRQRKRVALAILLSVSGMTDDADTPSKTLDMDVANRNNFHPVYSSKGLSQHKA